MSLAYPRLSHVSESLSFPEQFRADVLQGLSNSEKELPCKYLYDETGSKLYERICLLDEYYPTRTELGILKMHAADMGHMLGHGCVLIEYGSGASIKTRLLLDHMVGPAGYMPVDIAREQLQESALALAHDYPHLEIRPVYADFTHPLELPELQTTPQRRVVYFPGSTIGNLSHHEATTLLRQTAALCGLGGGLLLGADLKKEPQILHEAYNDRVGVTAAFNLNILTRINRELHGTFHVDRFWHHAFYNPRESRIEMHLVSTQDQMIAVDGHWFPIAEGESIRTECSRKYSLQDLEELAHSAGFTAQRVWMDDRRFFTVQYWTVGNTLGHLRE